MREFLGTEDVTVIIDDNRNLSDNIAKLVKELTGEWGWQMRKGYEMIGAEADRVVYIGFGALEAVSRARLSLGILLCCKNEQSWTLDNIHILDTEQQ